MAESMTPEGAKADLATLRRRLEGWLPPTIAKEVIDRIAALEAENELLRTDAERYLKRANLFEHKWQEAMADIDRAALPHP